MDVLWPGFLLLLGIIPLLIAVYVWASRRRRMGVRYSSLLLVREALPRQSRWRRHLPFALFMLTVSSLIVALSRPVAVVTVPTGQVTILLALDVSRSMCATDILPNRLTAAKDAALAFVRNQSAHTQIGIVAFAGHAELVQPPTSDKQILENAIVSLITARRTAIGSGLLEALDAIAAVDSSVAPTTRSAMEAGPTPVPNGAFAPDIVVLLTDGVSNQGTPPLLAAQQAADRGVRVYTIGFGTANENQSLPNCGGTGDPFGNDPFGGGFFGGGGLGFGGGGGGFRRGIDEETLQQVSEMTGGEYYSAESANELQAVFERLPTYLIAQHETMEISVAFAALGVILAALALVLAWRWQPLP